LWFPKKKHVWKNKAPKSPKPLLIYEAHIGMAQEKGGVGSYVEFRDYILPRIAEGNYNAIQLMGIQEHPYYGSFGYQVSSYFAPSSRFGTPDELKSLIDKAHSYGIAVILDLVHSHSVKNTLDGLSDYNGTEYQYFHSGPQGYHTLWDSRLFNYGKHEVQRFLLSNILYWLEEFHFDGFRFDGITSMLYKHHGHYKQFNHYDMYFSNEVDEDAICYLQLANEVIHEFNKEAISIAEDISGMPGLCRPISEGGIGFDYRMHMGVADFWIKIIKEVSDENWPLDSLYHELTTGRPGEKKVCYAESHDQAMVGDKTLSFQLMDKEMYSHMSKDTPSILIDRGISLLKLIRFMTISLGGEGYLNFMGNEFGHPEWIDFPRVGNNNSYHYARRQWSLKDNENLKYSLLANFDREMLKVFIENVEILDHRPELLNLDKANSVLIFSRGDYVWLFNFHPINSIESYQFGLDNTGKYKVIFESDNSEFGGFNRIDSKIKYETEEVGSHGRAHSLKIYTPSRSAILLKRYKA
jgi:1,4-alpha-glucan branching enzyme